MNARQVTFHVIFALVMFSISALMVDWTFRIDSAWAHPYLGAAYFLLVGFAFTHVGVMTLRDVWSRR